MLLYYLFFYRMAELGNWIISLLSKAPVPAKLIEGTVAGKFETQSVR